VLSCPFYVVTPRWTGSGDFWRISVTVSRQSSCFDSLCVVRRETGKE